MRTQLVVSLYALLTFFGLAACAQGQATSSGRQTLKAYSGVISAPNFDLEAAKQAAATSTGLKIFTYSINATKDQNIYSGTMVGSSPFAKKKHVYGASQRRAAHSIPKLSIICKPGFELADEWCERGHRTIYRRLPTGKLLVSGQRQLIQCESQSHYRPYPANV
jgi:hypothetical protein